jgi:pimeloyl-ACP methyl ester carboxylesterase
MRKVAICVFMLATMALSSFDIAHGQGEIFYLTFEQVPGEIRDPGIPGDGIIISSLPLAGFIVSPSFSLERVRNGITFSAFFRDTRDVTDINVNLYFRGRPPVPPCGFIANVGSSSPPILIPPVNGVPGIAVSFSQEELDALLDGFRQTPGCADLTVADLVLGDVLFLKGPGFNAIPDLDAFAVGLGVNVFPTETPPVVLVHGICGSPSSFGRMAELLSNDDFVVAEPFDYSTFNCPSAVSIEDLATLFAGHVRNILESKKVTQIDVVAHSMGGLIARAWMTGLLTNPTLAYRGEIRRLITIGTPHYGAAPAKWLNVIASPALDIQTGQMTFGSSFVWRLHDAWATGSHGMTPDRLLHIVGTQSDGRLECNERQGCDDGVVQIASAVLPDSPIERIRYVPYRHADIIVLGVHVILPANGPTLVGVNSNTHATYRLIREFLRSGGVIKQCCGPDTLDYFPPHLRGNVGEAEGLVLIRAMDTTGKPVNRRLDVQFSPSIDARIQHGDGTVTLWGVEEGNYAITVCVRGFAPEEIFVQVRAARPSVPEALEFIDSGLPLICR